jgi:hypothetical protein
MADAAAGGRPETFTVRRAVTSAYATATAVDALPLFTTTTCVAGVGDQRPSLDETSLAVIVYDPSAREPSMPDEGRDEEKPFGPVIVPTGARPEGRPVTGIVRLPLGGAV